MTTRRDFLTIASMAGVASFLAACASNVIPTISLSQNSSVTTEVPPEPVLSKIVGDGTTEKLEVIARMTVRKGKLDGFKKQAAECIRQTKEKDTKTLRYDWFLSNDETEVEIHEAYINSDGLIEHRMHIGDALNVLFSEYADNHTVTVFGNPSPQLVEAGNAQMAGRIKWYSFLKGLES